MAKLSDKLIISHLLAFIVGVVVAYFAIPALNSHGFGAFKSKPERTVQSLPPMEITHRSEIPQTVTPATRDLSGALVIPVQGIVASQLSDTFTQARGTDRVHDAIDIMAPDGTPVLAASDGRIEKLWSSDLGGITIYQFNPERTYSYYYAHLSGYAPGLAEGQLVRKGDVIGYVGHTGNASPDGPHLHFAIHALPKDASWSDGEPVNPYPILMGTSQTN